ncbi:MULTISPECIES: dipeptide/oligopeptide/nickel ABC transporter permease/ATP-binding protein [unclassified Actinomyces]|uniref:dipeptide/oligopeptide/nickel ABC transporter permease/ATP-binding protein n=1 Tax=unclassified Actinomyces TaxID=2609248 RepID=UPI002017F6BA|nr:MULTISPECIES: dipeptide/oligopeptide/nickel ABC transporter permease/ATP-binding protein [unclassified Actinomyces]MCL3777424.1 dipeptide/oligopeptide/nickel ABC transporter permease/ATP-binding protein [Actinomyces sp. AC-20-1]MCL3790518.1 dipeptide/oligopeptide/nickel ABC transporter permease/ATP-binding protein [Actinomyces sp. 187325]MCL3792094.1 dipeptide/oligopeptide/nickel ABC transporter permease/ATP-binding protein [Actinomyces sp. 186855]MCL3795207.1 dipeptide/oligopeptide/nickel A
MSAPTTETTTSTRTGRERRGTSVLLRLLRNPLAVICLLIVLAVLLTALLAPVLAPLGPQTTDLAATNAPPGTPGHPLGGDSSGRDILSRLIWGSRQTVVSCLIMLAVSLTAGVSTGLLAGFYRGRLETVAGFVTDVLMSLPSIILLIALYAVTGPNIPVMMAVFGLLTAPTYYRLVRSVVVSVRNELYVDAARVVGLSDARIIGRHVLWAVRAPVVIQGAFILASGIGIEAGMSFLGLGNPAGVSWGVMLQVSFNGIYNNPVAVVWPAAVISVTILALILLGNALSDVLQASARARTVTSRQRRDALAATTAQHADSEPRPPDPGAAVSIRGLRVGYTHDDGFREVVHGIDLDIRQGEIHGLVGESGSGKSQIAFSVLGILPKEALRLGGSIHIDGVDVLADARAMRAARGRKVAYVPQEPMSNLDPSFTIGKQLEHGMRAATTLSRQEIRERTVTLLHSVGIADAERVMGLYPHEVSGGMAQRVLICGALASDPEVIVADEPTTALDVTVQAEILDLLRDLAREAGLAVLFVTHNLGVVADLCDTVSVMRDGHIVETQDVESLFAHPREEYTRELLASSLSVELMETES